MTEIIYKYFDDFSAHQVEQIEMLYPLYKDWNEKINVISRKDIDQIYLHHVLHSLSIAAIAGFTAEDMVIDIGCGGGFPGVPLAIFFTETEFILVDSIGKKLKVVDAVCEAAGIKNITTIHGRVEEIKNRKFNYAVSRAVAPLKDLWNWSSPLLKKKAVDKPLANGLICLKGGDLHQEISDSNVRPTLHKIESLFPEPYFKDKFLVHVRK